MAGSSVDIVICPYCNKQAKLVDGSAIYPHRHDLYAKKFWLCKPCGAYVGCHAANNGYGNGSRPLGRLADAELRAAKLKAHAAFDPIWKTTGIARGKAYAWLAEELNINSKDCHIGMFDVAQCNAVIAACERFDHDAS